MAGLAYGNFISGEVFKKGVENTILNKKGNNLEKVFLIIFNSEDGIIISSSKELIENEDISYSGDINDNGGSIKINVIDNKFTKNYLSEGTSEADSYAIIKTKHFEESIINTKDGDVTTYFPIIGEGNPYSILLKGKLSNKPLFSSGTSFQFNSTTIFFGVTNFNEY